MILLFLWLCHIQSTLSVIYHMLLASHSMILSVSHRRLLSFQPMLSIHYEIGRGSLSHHIFFFSLATKCTVEFMFGRSAFIK